MATNTVPVVGDKKPKAPPTQSSSLHKEREVASDNFGVSEVKEHIKSQEALDEQALKAISGEIEGARLKEPTPKVGADISMHLKSPQEEADNVVKQGSTISVGVTQEEYEEGNKEKVEVKKDWTTLVYWGPKSLVAAVIRAGRLIKIAHTHALKVVFRKSNKEAA